MENTKDEIAARYDSFLQSSRSIISQSMQGQNRVRQSNSEVLLEDLRLWDHCLKGRPESLFISSATAEIQFGLFAIASGMYRHAFFSLRLTTEYVLACVYYGNHLLELSEWLLDTKDLRWATLSDCDNGPLSIRYAKAFFPVFSDSVKEQHIELVKVYRHCSEFVHGNKHTHDSLSNRLHFNQGVFDRWHSNLDKLATLFSYVLALRYHQGFSPELQSQILPTLISRLGHIMEIRETLTGAK
jgi:hypothetical protein